MTSTVQLPILPNFLITFWRLQKDEAWQAKKRKGLEGWKASSLAEAYLKYQLRSHSRVQEAQDHVKSVPPTLSSIAAGKVLEVLSTSENFEADLSSIVKSLNSTTITQLLADPRTPYLVLRAFQNYLQAQALSKNPSDQKGIIDTDEAILASERYIRSRGETNRDDKYLVGLKELFSILLESSDSSIDDTKLEFVRKDPPKGGFEFLDAFRERVMQIQPNDASFIRTFQRITKGALDGLDWSNVFVAGGMALTTLTHTDPSKDDERSVRDCDIDLYLYGLNPEEANRKVEEIYTVWSNNLPSTNRQKLIVKNAKTINFLASYPNRRIQIILKLLPSPTDILLNFDLDACAIGFNGSRVFMLPRFARAIETGYSIFTMDLVWGHHLGNRQATQEKRVFKYADRGFGLRILPSYAMSVEEDSLEKTIENIHPARRDNDMADAEMTDEEETDSELRYPPKGILQLQRNRKPDGPEPGLKTLKRIAYLGQDFVNRFYFGATPLTVFPDRGEEWAPEENIDDEERIKTIEEEEWKAYICEVLSANKALQEADEKQRLHVVEEYGPFLSFAILDSNDMHGDLPDGRRGLGCFELFMRHCEAWRLHARAYATLDETSFASTVYDAETYDDLPTYTWNESLDLDSFVREIDLGNDRLFGCLRTAICEKLGIDFRLQGYNNYLTRRIRRQVHGPDLASVQEKQITIPLIIPWDLENFILNDLPNQYSDLPQHLAHFKHLIPVHDHATHDLTTATLPSLQETVTESGNLRYWVLTNENMWAGQHRAQDEIAEVLWSFFHYFHQEMRKELPNPTDGNGTNEERCVWHLARSFRRRIVLPEVPSDDTPQANMPSRPGGGRPRLRESLLFRPWVFYTPKVPDRDHQAIENDENPPHFSFDEENYLYPFPDGLFWKDGDEGEWTHEGVPAWREVGRDAKAGDGVRRNGLGAEEVILTEETMALLDISRGEGRVNEWDGRLI